MPLSLSATAILEKNKIASSGAWITFLAIAYPGETTIRVCDNNETTGWAGYSWTPAAFGLDAISETKDGDIQSTQLTFNDPDRVITPHLETYSGGVGASVTMYVAHSSNLASPTSEVEYIFSITQAAIDWKNTITLTLGAENLYHYRFPQDRYLKNHCQWKTFKGTGCLSAVTGSPSAAYTAATTCDRSFSQCRVYGNQARFRGAPAMGKTGIFK